MMSMFGRRQISIDTIRKNNSNKKQEVIQEKK